VRLEGERAQAFRHSQSEFRNGMALAEGLPPSSPVLEAPRSGD
jgi:hypothetical protein